MAMRYRKSVSLGKGARINVSKTGLGVSAGPRGARYSVHSSGRRTASTGIPGTGLHYVSTRGGGSKSRRAVPNTTGMTEAQQRRLMERFEKKNTLINERRERPLNKLKEAYASGKMEEAEFNKLQERGQEVEKDLIIFGRGAGVKLAERYILGKIDEEEFSKLKHELIPGPEEERKRLIEEYKEVMKAVSDFIEQARGNQSDTECNYCKKPKKFFSPLLKKSNFKLCMSCSKKYNNVREYGGFTGQYYAAAPLQIDPDIKNNLSVNILPDHILNYR